MLNLLVGLAFGLSTGYLIGYQQRELRNFVAAIGARVAKLKSAQDIQEKAKGMDFAGPLSKEELEALDEQDRINAFNKGKL